MIKDEDKSSFISDSSISIDLENLEIIEGELVLSKRKEINISKENHIKNLKKNFSFKNAMKKVIAKRNVKNLYDKFSRFVSHKNANDPVSKAIHAKRDRSNISDHKFGFNDTQRFKEEFPLSLIKFDDKKPKSFMQMIRDSPSREHIAKRKKKNQNH